MAVAGNLACSLGVRRSGIARLAIGIGMIPRGEVGLIFANVGAGLTLNGAPIIGRSTFSAIVGMVVATTVVTPPAADLGAPFQTLINILVGLCHGSYNSGAPGRPPPATSIPSQRLGMNQADTAWMLVSTALVLLMTPALAFFYGGLVRSKNALNTMMMSFAALGFVGLAWVLIGYSLAFSTGNNWIGDTSRAFLHGVGLDRVGAPHDASARVLLRRPGAIEERVEHDDDELRFSRFRRRDVGCCWLFNRVRTWECGRR